MRLMIRRDASRSSRVPVISCMSARRDGLSAASSTPFTVTLSTM
jgi:hypothetical protein